MTTATHMMLTRREVAEILGYRENTIDVYRRRTRDGKMDPPFPEPADYLGNRPWWTPESIEAYKRLRDGPITGLPR